MTEDAERHRVDTYRRAEEDKSLMMENHQAFCLDLTDYLPSFPKHS